MPTQEDRVLARIRQVTAYIRDAGEKGVKAESVENWAFVTLGIRPRTTQLYLKSLLDASWGVHWDAIRKVLVADKPEVKAK